VLTLLGMPASDDTVLRHLKQAVVNRSAPKPEAVGIDEWAWRKGWTFGTIVVDLQSHDVVDLLPERSAEGTADWLRRHPSVHVISRDRDGLYAQAGRMGAPQACQVADRFHLAQNFRAAVERQLCGLEQPLRTEEAPAADMPDRQVPTDDEGTATPSTSRGQSCTAGHLRLVEIAGDETKRSLFIQVRALYEAGYAVNAIAGRLGLGRRRVDRWVRLVELPERNRMGPQLRTPAYFREHLARRWAEGCTHGGRLFQEIRSLGYVGSYSHLARLLSPWRREGGPRRTVPSRRSTGTLPPDVGTGRRISPLVAAKLCVLPRGMLLTRQAATVDALKAALPDFAAMRGLAMRFRGLLRSGSEEKLEQWINDAYQSGIYAMQRIARTLRQDFAAVKLAVTTSWNNGPTEGQINRLKTLKRAMYGRAGVELLRARMQPLPTMCKHQS
jgi:hypothetical protein